MACRYWVSRKLVPLLSVRSQFGRGTVEGIARRILQLERQQVQIGRDNYSQTLKIVAAGKKPKLLQLLLENDHGPEQLTNAAAQEALLARYFSKEDWTRYDSLLTLLSATSEDPESTRLDWSLQVYLRKNNINGALKIVEKMRLQSKIVPPRTVARLVHAVLRPRKKGNHPNTFKGNHADLSVTVKVLVKLVESGSAVPHRIWREIFTRLGQTGQLDNLEALVRWLVTWYIPETAGVSRLRLAPLSPEPSFSQETATSLSTTITVPRSASTLSYSHPIRKILDKNMLRAIIDWGLHGLVSRPPPQAPENALITTEAVATAEHFRVHHPWIRGIVFLQELKARGVHVDSGLVAAAVNSRLRQIYGSRISDKKVNRKLREMLTGRYEPLQMLEIIRNAWGPGLEYEKVAKVSDTRHWLFEDTGTPLERFEGSKPHTLTGDGKGEAQGLIVGLRATSSGD